MSVTLRCLSTAIKSESTSRSRILWARTFKPCSTSIFRVGKLVGVPEGKLALLARLLEDRGAERGGKLGPRAEPAVHPHLDIIGARGDDLVDLGARLLRCHHLGVGRKAVPHGGHPD